MPSEIPIVYDTVAIAKRIRQLERERQQARVQPLQLPPGYAIVLPTDTSIPKNAKVLFLLQLSSNRIEGVLVLSSHVGWREAVANLMACLKAEVSSMRWVGDKIYMPLADCGRLAERVRETRALTDGAA